MIVYIVVECKDNGVIRGVFSTMEKALACVKVYSGHVIVEYTIDECVQDT